VEVREPTKLSFGVVIGVDGRLGILDEGTCPKGKGRGSGILFPHWFRGVNRHFQAKRAKYSNVHIIETTA